MHRTGFRLSLPGNDPNLSEKVAIQKWEILSFSPLGVWSGVQCHGTAAAGREGKEAAVAKSSLIMLINRAETAGFLQSWKEK